MSSLVFELQQECMNQKVKVSNILRKALVVATKLEIQEFREWCEKELHGYKTQQEAPEYRAVHGEIKVFNPYHGWQPIIFENSGIAKSHSQRRVTQSIGELENIVENHDSKDALQMPFSQEILKTFSNTECMQLGLVPTLLISQSKIYGIIDSARNIVLEWSLKLEKDGILGEGLTFSDHEKKIASSVTYNIQHFTGVAGNVHTQNLQIGNYNSIHAELKILGISQEERNELESILDSLPKVEKKEKESLLKKGFQWLNRHKAILGTLYELIKSWFESAKAT